LCAALFITFGLVGGCLPSIHVIIVKGLRTAVENYALGWLALMATLYISGALIYAFRVPERLCPGKFDIWVHPFYFLLLFISFFVVLFIAMIP